MKAKEFQYVRDCTENEGFEYCFINYSNFDEIKDGEFHALRIAYVEAYKKLSDYLGIEN